MLQKACVVVTLIHAGLDSDLLPTDGRGGVLRFLSADAEGKGRRPDP